jgi:hypothetical protein
VGTPLDFRTTPIKNLCGLSRLIDWLGDSNLEGASWSDFRLPKNQGALVSTLSRGHSPGCDGIRGC